MSSPAATSATRPTGPIEGSSISFGFSNTYARLPERLFARVKPTPVIAPRMLKLNVALARTLGLDPIALDSPEVTEILAGNRIAQGSEPLAQAYAGHQFGAFVPQLGDGRAILLGEIIAPDGQCYDIQLKGPGPTPFSRRGDGRAAVGPVLREYIISEAMAALGVPTTRSLAAVATGERVVRETYLPGAVLTRVAASHLRVGTFQFFAARSDVDALRALTDYAIARHYPELAQSPKPVRAFFEAVVIRQARLIAQWMLVGFIHGVMNTDNTSISGETIDYGPCAFMEAYDPATVFSSIDFAGRYSYQNQPHAAHWNLARLAESLLPLLQQEEGSEPGAIDSATEALNAFATHFDGARTSGFRHKIGLLTDRNGDDTLWEDLLARMHANQADFTLTFRRLSDAAADPVHDSAVRALFTNPASFDEWAARWRQRLAAEPASAEDRAAAMRRVNPAFIPRNHLVEEALTAASDRDDLQPFEALLDAISCPFDDRPGLERYTLPARPEERVCQTFCGT